jgi:hypothetical protein
VTDDDVAKRLGFDTYAEFEAWLDRKIEATKKDVISRHTFRTRTR